ncbi:Fe-S cluster assembly ATPase SufC [Helcococcus ovis]|uniref:Fe-S cluster assembly ATPase SufC n=1 Tax=Helcococcus ovis TaxID=72026 RepID=A0A4R9C1U5_9FIRM|nr:Fe-S cluster assembly ATPase SufC [Helcococcus ovis]TFF65078.1 Fe-S cluster assembly ATPase SufC [Helcococcus ovis]TFF66723.1 Fe-S cluster assembly ATPase SufC [Helcococcus ovis]TFF67431.1 Fe-S cluster assembly ATPase SufC [Helcococcus ovis]WNZ01553.1 Fe-S cluster assembly ATPase SufC [Helcococcus ovis]
MLQIRNLHAKVKDKEILNGINLEINDGEVHVIMGPNGSGKSTLTKVIMDHPDYKMTDGQIIFCGEDISDLSTDKRAKLGMFLSFQNPEEVEGISVENFIRTAQINLTGEKSKLLMFRRELKKQLQELGFDKSYAERYLNVGFSGGEKKKNEILQMKILKPKFIMLDETDSGLDIDATKIVSKEVNSFLTEEKSALIITHHSSILENIKPDKVHVMINGKIVKTGDASLINEIELNGYQQFRDEVNND